MELCSFILHFILHIFLVFIVVVVIVLLGKVRLINFYSKTGPLDGEITVKWKNWVQYNYVTTAFSGISLIKLWNHLANNSVYLVHSRAGLQSKTKSTYNTEDNRGSARDSPCPVFLWHLIWKQKFRIFNEAPQLFSEQANFPLTFKSCFMDTHLTQKLYNYGHFPLSLRKESAL